jgi:hypothetical protein
VYDPTTLAQLGLDIEMHRGKSTLRGLDLILVVVKGLAVILTGSWPGRNFAAGPGPTTPRTFNRNVRSPLGSRITASIKQNYALSGSALLQRQHGE